MNEIGPAGWVAIGVTGMAAAGAAHAVTGAGNIVRSIFRSPGSQGAGALAGADAPSDSGAGGWVLLSALILAGGAMYHVVAGTGTLVKEILHAASH